MRATQIDQLINAIEAYEQAALGGSDAEKNLCLAALDRLKRNSSQGEIGAAYRLYVDKTS